MQPIKTLQNICQMDFSIAATFAKSNKKLTLLNGFCERRSNLLKLTKKSANPTFLIILLQQIVLSLLIGPVSYITL